MKSDLINDYIQEKAGHSANIIMGVGEDLNLEEFNFSYRNCYWI